MSSYPNFIAPIGGAAKPAFVCPKLGTPPDPEKIQAYPGVERKYLPHEALIIYTEKLYDERKAYQTPSGDRWFKEHKQIEREKEKLEQSIRSFRESRALHALVEAKTPYEKKAALSRTSSFPGLVAKEALNPSC
eukprot:TRINITY_DN34912_c0_g1_i1.p1 TRINITY_DN34912_c0_g1~~TRINITY_DN34912_c0_g1_i1.p1  ORF type:complete len:134 (+),score=21.62 TRINITY_DN34912_c0_g1_i1:25-426(+)